jgi:hypothetical protein
VIHSYISVPHRSGTKAEFNVITTPQQLKNLDTKRLNKVLTQSRRLLGPIPYYGGDIEVEIGLFSIKSGDLVEPFLSTLEGFASIAGVSVLETAMPFVAPLRKGIQLLLDSQGDSVLEIGLHTELDTVTPGVYAVIGVDRNSLDEQKIKLDAQYQVVYDDGKPMRDYPYFVMEITHSTRHENWPDIPSLGKPYKDLHLAVLDDDIARVQESFAVFRRTVMMSPDLIESHAQNLVKDVQDKVDDALKPKQLSTSEKIGLPDLKEFDPFR